MAVILWRLLFAYISLIPFYYLQPVGFGFNASTISVAKYLPAGLILLLALLAALERLRVRRPARSPRTVLDLSVLVYLLTSALSLIGSAYPTIGVLKLTYYTLTGLLLPYLLIAHRKDRSHNLARWAVAIAALVAFYGFTVYLSGRDYLLASLYRAHNPYYSGTSRVSSTLGNAVYCGSYLALCLPFALWAFRSETRPIWKKYYAACCGLILLALFLTFTRGAWLAATLAAVVYFAPRAGHLLARARRVLTLHRIVIGLTLLLLVIPILQGLGFDAPMSRAWTTFWHRLDRATELETSESFRIAQYRTTANVLRDHSLLGLGFGTFTRQFDQYKHASTPSSSTTTTENMVLMTASEIGLLGLIAFLVLLFALLRSFYRGYQASDPDSEGRPQGSPLRTDVSPAPLCWDANPGAVRDLHLAALAAVCGFLVNMLTWDALNQPTVRITFWMLAGIALAQSRYHEQKNKDAPLKRSAPGN